MTRATTEPPTIAPTAGVRARMEALAHTAQQRVCDAVERLEGEPCRESVWQDGGTTYVDRVLEHGRVFDKVGVNFAVVRGTLTPAMARAALGADTDLADSAPAFYATAASIVLHPRNPHAPSGHCNVRYFEVEPPEMCGEGGRAWFGGLADLTPSYVVEEDAQHFHGVLRETCDAHDPAFYPRFKAWCDEYFHLPHRNEHRGIGGIFYDRLHDREPDALVAFAGDLADAFRRAYFPLVERRKDLPATPEQRRWQQLRRGRYVEFNLAVDRGTTFGLKSGGRTQSILMALPPSAEWAYDAGPRPGTPEAETVAILRNARKWA